MGKLIYFTITRLDITYALDWLVILCRSLERFIGKSSWESWHTLKDLLVKVWCIRGMDICELKLFHILIMQKIKKIESLPLTTALILEAIWLLERVRSRALCLVRVLKQSIER